MPRSRKSRYAPKYRTLLSLLCEAREASGITQVELSARIGTSQSMLSKLERGVVRMDITDMLDYLDGIEAEPLEFMSQFLQRIGGPKQKRARAK